MKNNFTEDNARKLAKLLLSLKKERREKIVCCLDSEFAFRVLEEMNILKEDMPFDLRDTLPPGRIPNCS
jgi:Mg/Co/Ni transporter MgtE